MHDNFEREVQKKMDELNLSPSAPVWEKIELQIRLEKRRRRVLVWFLLGALLLVGGLFSYQFFINSKSSAESISKEDSNHQARPDTQSSTTTTTKIEEKNSTSVVTTNDSFTTEQATINSYKTSETKLENPSALVQPANLSAAKKASSTLHKQTVKYSKQSHSKIKVGIKSKPSESTTIENNITAGSTINLPLDTSVQTQTAETTLTDQPGSKTDSVKPVLPEKAIQLPVDSSSRKKVASNKNWQRKISFAVGLSDQVAGVGATKAIMDPVSQNSGIGNGSGSPAFASRPAGIRSSFSFLFGYEISRRLNDHFELSLGLQYAYYSTKLLVGDSRRSDTAVRYGTGNFSTNQFFTNAGQSDFTNRFHTVQVPVTIHYKPSLATPLYVAVGASYGQMIATNALTYSSGSNVYYRNRENDVRSLLPVHASVQVGLFEKSKSSWRIGPAVQYNVLKLQKENPTNASHLFFAGLQSTINF